MNGDATYNARFFPGTLWTTPGGDFDPTASATATVGSVINNPYTWLTTLALVSDVQGRLDSPATNFGWEIINTDEPDMQTFLAFYARDFVDPTLGSGLQPQLKISFDVAAAVPEPSTLGLTVLGAVTIISLRCRQRRRNALSATERTT